MSTNPRETRSVDEILASQSKVTPAQAQAAYFDFIKLVNVRFTQYVHSEENMLHLLDWIVLNGGPDQLQFSASWQEAFLMTQAKGTLPTLAKTPEEVAREKAEREAQRIADLTARDLQPGSYSENVGKKSDQQIASEAEQRQAAFEATKAQIEARRQEIINAHVAAEDVAQPSIGDAFAALKATGYKRSEVIRWLRTTDSGLVREVRKIDGIAAKIDAAVRGDNG